MAANTSRLAGKLMQTSRAQLNKLILPITSFLSATFGNDIRVLVV